MDDLLHVLLVIGLGAHDQDTVEQVDGKTVRTPELRPSYPRHPSVGGHDDQGGKLIFQGAVEE
jgi:hypothetical protein